MWAAVRLSRDDDKLRRIQNWEVQRIQTVFETVQPQIRNLRLLDQENYGLSEKEDRADGNWSKYSLLDGRISEQMQSKVWRNRSRPGCQGPQRKYAGLFIHDIKEVEDVGQQEQQSDKRDNEEGDEVKRSEATLTVRMKHEDDYGMNGDSNLSNSVRTSKQGRQSRDDDTN